MVQKDAGLGLRTKRLRRERFEERGQTLAMDSVFKKWQSVLDSLSALLQCTPQVFPLVVAFHH